MILEQYITTRRIRFRKCMRRCGDTKVRAHHWRKDQQADLHFSVRLRVF